MSDPCRALKSTDPEAASLCHLLTQEMGVPLESIDKGVPYIRCTKSKCQMQIVEGTAGNGIPEAGEVYEASIALMHKEENAFAASDGKTKRRFTDLVGQKNTFRVPWLFNDFNKSTDHDDGLLLETSKKIRETKDKTGNNGHGKKEGTYSFNRKVLERLVRWMEDPDGMGIVRVGMDKHEPTLIEFCKNPEGDCTELSRNSYAISRLAEFSPTFVDVQRNKFDSETYSHNAVGVRLDPSNPDRITVVDLYYGVILEEGHLMQSEMPAISALAVYHLNKAHSLMTDKNADRERDAERLEKLFLKALRYDPYYAPIHYNYALFLENWKGDRQGARIEAKKARQLRPDHPIYRDFSRYLGEPK